MRFLDPALLLWAIPVIAAIIFLYLFRLRRQERRISSLMLWGHALQEMQANAPFRRLRANWLMALQILAALALVVALARPYRTVPGVSGRCVAVVLDSSASMRATDVSPTRFDRAKAEASELIEGLGRDDSMCLVIAGSPTRVAAPLSSDKSALRAALASVTATDCPARGDEAVRLALSLIQGRAGGRVVVLSDGGFPELGVSGAATLAITYVRIGRSDDNVAITALDSRPGPDGRPLVLASVRNFSQRKRPCDLEIRADGALADVQRLSLAAGEETSRVFSAPRGAQHITVRLDVKDHLASDNEAHLLTGGGKQRSGLLLTNGNLFLQKALALDPRVSFVRSAAPTGVMVGRHDLYIFDRMAPTAPAAGALLFIAAANAQAPVRVSGVVSNPQVTGWNREHPITRWVDFSDLHIARAQKATALDWGQPLVYARDTPLVVVGERRGIRAIYIAWNLMDSDLPLRVGFPIFIANCIQWLVGDVGGAPMANLRTGDVFALTPAVAAPALDVKLPGGGEVKVPVSGGTAALRLDRAGVYEARAGKYRAFAAANLLDAGESSIAPRDALTIAGRQVASVGRRPRRTQEYWRLVILAVLGLSGLEWLAYHRRI